MNPSVLKTSMAAYFQRVGNLADRESLASPVAFIQYFKEVLPEALNRTDWGEGDAFIDLVAGGRLPKTPMQWEIATADRLAGGWDRETFDAAPKEIVPWPERQKIRLAPALEQLKTDGVREAEVCRHAYPLKPLGPETIFPGLLENGVPADAEAAEAEWRELFDGFREGLRSL